MSERNINAVVSKDGNEKSGEPRPWGETKRRGHKKNDVNIFWKLLVSWREDKTVIGGN
jgi:hypothetical protein